MAIGDTEITLVGNLVQEPALRFTPTGQAIATFRVASTSRLFDRQTGEWRDGDSLFITCSAWRQTGENLIESGLARGDRVIVHGRLRQRSYEAKDGTPRTVYEIDVLDVGPSLRNAIAKVTRIQRHTTTGSFGDAAGTADAPRTPAEDPWASSSSAGTDDEPPF
ncbi:single-stranded DNA-binding protein [Actinomadura sp. NBRC 104425]|uniref:single-stranded DNA-binding protein n=1 Tax=Actinomadura sp. NBRC 104425 TaxID=3032204 RepID=UPI0024A08317|nr:single-stranded DNA-binding protein [Actinomadura sp. NBRC 104425]GLZ14877.1 single-stranded DNA-binding protein [Actinomadura sp. NBRC 104425]